MARIPEGRMILQVTIDKETATRLRVKAALSGMPVGHLLDAWAKTFDLPEMESRSVPEKPKKQQAKKPQKSKTLAPSDEDVTPMTYAELHQALQDSGKSKGELQAHLGLKNVSVWAKDGIPGKHLAAIRQFLAQ